MERPPAGTLWHSPDMTSPRMKTPFGFVILPPEEDKWQGLVAAKTTKAYTTRDTFDWPVHHKKGEKAGLRLEDFGTRLLPGDVATHAWLMAATRKSEEIEEGSMVHEHYVSDFGRWPIHPRSSCEGSCPFHNPSNHPMRDWPMLIRETALVERMCPHLVGHPDPDSVKWMDDKTGQGTWGTHGCDLCCIKAGNEEPIMEIGPKHEVSFVLKETRIAIGGLMRCCTGSLTEFINQNPEDMAGVGTLLHCKYEKNDPTSMILGQDGVWRWNHP